MYKRQQDERNHNQRLAQMQEETRLKLSEPDYATINNRRVRIDPTTGKSEVLYTAPQDFDDYAASLGAEPGTDEYDRLVRSEEHTSELQSLMRISYAVFCLKKKTKKTTTTEH